jgi:succinyl-diaminopimelate desuccinylase
MSSVTDPVERTIELCQQLSVTGSEGDLATSLEQRYRDAGEEVARVGDSVIMGEPDDRPLVLLVGHIDVVPPTDADRRPRRAELDGTEVIVGRGTSDMKSGVAVAEALFADDALREGSPYGLALVLYAREEGPADDNELADVLDEVDWLSAAALAVVLEPTDLRVELGCTGSLQAELTFRGRQAHSARPWTGENALTKAVPALVELDARDPVEVAVDGVTYRDVLTPTQAWTDNPKNVAPGRFVLNVNLRFAPSRGLAGAEEELRAWVGDRADIDIVDRAPPAPPFRGEPLVDRLVEIVGAEVGGKQGWTDVARFAQIGVPALNYGPGLSSQAHQEGEFVPVANIDTAVERLRRFLAG